MLKVQELEFGGNKYRLREPRIRDYMNSLGKEGVEASCIMLGGMLLDEQGKAIGYDAATELPLLDFEKLADALSTFMSNREVAPLPAPNDSNSASP
jgi:hypothetical protein